MTASTSRVTSNATAASDSTETSGDRQARAEWLARRLHEAFTEPERQTLIAAAALLERLVQR